MLFSIKIANYANLAKKIQFLHKFILKSTLLLQVEDNVA